MPEDNPKAELINSPHQVVVIQQGAGKDGGGGIGELLGDLFDKPEDGDPSTKLPDRNIKAMLNRHSLLIVFALLLVALSRSRAC